MSIVRFPDGRVVDVTEGLILKDGAWRALEPGEGSLADLDEARVISEEEISELTKPKSKPA